MSYITTEKNLLGKFRVTKHAVDRFKDEERYGDEYIGGKKIKNMSDRKAKKKIRKSLKSRRKFISENGDGTIYVRTKDFEAIVKPEFHNKVITVF